MRGRKKQDAETVSEPIETPSLEAFTGNAHALLKAIYQDVTKPLDVRLEAAKAAIGYEMPKLTAMKHTGDPNNPIETLQRVEMVIIDPAVPRDEELRGLHFGPTERRMQ